MQSPGCMSSFRLGHDRPGGMATGGQGDPKEYDKDWQAWRNVPQGLPVNSSNGSAWYLVRGLAASERK
jgi:hypothetical protein